MVSLTSLLSSFKGPDKHYVKIVPPAPAYLTQAEGHIGVILEVETLSKIGKYKDEPNGFIMVRFLLEDGEHEYRGRSTLFEEVNKSEVPSDLAHALEARAANLQKSLTQAMKDEAAAHKAAVKEATEAQARLDAIFEKSNTFWRAWKGTGEVPKHADDPEGVNATNRKAPKIS